MIICHILLNVSYVVWLGSKIEHTGNDITLFPVKSKPISLIEKIEKILNELKANNYEVTKKRRPAFRKQIKKAYVSYNGVYEEEGLYYTKRRKGRPWR